MRRSKVAAGQDDRKLGDRGPLASRQANSLATELDDTCRQAY